MSSRFAGFVPVVLLSQHSGSLLIDHTRCGCDCGWFDGVLCVPQMVDSSDPGLGGVRWNPARADVADEVYVVVFAGLMASVLADLAVW